MSQGLYLTLVFTLVPLSVIGLAVWSEPFLRRASGNRAFALGAVVLATLGMTVVSVLALQPTAAATGLLFPPREWLTLNERGLLSLAFLVGVPALTTGLILWGQPVARRALRFLSAETASAMGAMAALTGGIVAEVVLAVRLVVP
jgi:hypothetical protein